MVGRGRIASFEDGIWRAESTRERITGILIENFYAEVVAENRTGDKRLHIVIM